MNNFVSDLRISFELRNADDIMKNIVLKGGENCFLPLIFLVPILVMCSAAA